MSLTFSSLLQFYISYSVLVFLPIRALIFRQDYRMNKIFLSFLMKSKKHHLFSRQRRLRRRNVFEELSNYFYPIHSRAESAIVLSWLHLEVAKEINPINPVRKYF